MARYSFQVKKSVARDVLEPVALRTSRTRRSKASPKQLSRAELPETLRAIPKRDVARILKRMAALADEPRGADCEKLSSRELYRVRQGKYRILYEIRDADRAIVVVKVAHRSKAYDNM